MFGVEEQCRLKVDAVPMPLRELLSKVRRTMLR
jgi:hypothetical protein